MRELLAILVVLSTACAASAPSAPVGIQVIGAGLGRTGTLSLQAALEILGYKTHHYINMSRSNQWAQWADGLISSDAMIDAIVDDGYTATCDNPSADLFAEQLARFPKARVVLSLRDSAEKWETSWMVLFNTIQVTESDFSWTFPSFLQWIPLMKELKALRCRMGTHLGLPRCKFTSGWRQEPAGWLAKQYDAHNALVEATVPQDQLLKFNVKQGWAPLCAFLGKDIPSVPFPHAQANSSQTMQAIQLLLTLLTFCWIPALLVIAVMGYRCLRPGKRPKVH